MPETDIKTVVLRVMMHCEGCASTVKRAVKRIPGMTSYQVDFAGQKVTVIGAVKPEEVFRRVAKTGKYTEFWPEEPKKVAAAAAKKEEKKEEKQQQQQPKVEKKEEKKKEDNKKVEDNNKKEKKKTEEKKEEKKEDNKKKGADQPKKKEENKTEGAAKDEKKKVQRFSYHTCFVPSENCLIQLGHCKCWVLLSHFCAFGNCLIEFGCYKNPFPHSPIIVL